ncbi:MAG: hypothetical protein HYR84_14755 [Planctomycetes bacterium]|nr:hypothetical protein [Planctomycetota bacterium]
MRTTRTIIGIALAWALGAMALAQPGVPARLGELPKRTADWPPAWAALVRDVSTGSGDFERQVLSRVDALLKAEDPAKKNYRLAEMVLSATLRHHQSVRRPAPLANQPDLPLQRDLETRLNQVRKDWLDQLRNSDDPADALQRSEQWLSAAAHDGPLRSAIVALWVDQAHAAVKNADYAAARGWFDRLETHFAGDPPIDAVRKALHEQAQSRWKTPGQTLIVGVRALPEQLSPATAWTEVERQTLELLFDRLFDVEIKPGGARRYLPRLATQLPTPGTSATLSLRRDVYWSNGDRLTAADLEHTARLLAKPGWNGRSSLWHEFLELPRWEGHPFRFPVSFHQGLFDPLAPLDFWVLPRFYRKPKELASADDAEFAVAPLGTGPFQLVIDKADDAKKSTRFQRNPHDLRHGPFALQEIRMAAWRGADKDFPNPPPHLLLDAPTDQLAALEKRQYVDRSAPGAARLHILAVNHARPMLAATPVRRAIAHAIDRNALLDRHFRGGVKKYHAPANGLLPRDSWANAPAAQVGDLFHLDKARTFAAQVAKPKSPSTLTLKFPTGAGRVQAACDEIASTLTKLFRDAQVPITVQAQALPPHDLRRVLHRRDYDLLYITVDDLDDPVRLALFFDRQADARNAGGSNILAYDDDKLQGLLRGVLQYRQFAVVQENMQAIHAHLDLTMPAIPLWHLDVHVLVHRSLETPAIDPRAAFAKVRAWNIVP